MPTSHLYQLTQIVELIALAEPQSVLDIGVGFGKYGVLSREYLEFWDGREEYHQWSRRVDGIEVFPEYLTPLHDYVYDHVYTGNAFDVLPHLDVRYDLILLIDVLEHVDYEEGVELLTLCLRHGRNVIISTPRDIGEQGDAFENPHETHRFQWRRKHLRFLEDRFFVPNLQSLICFAGEDASAVHRRLLTMRYKHRSRIVRHALRRATASARGLAAVVKGTGSK